MDIGKPKTFAVAPRRYTKYSKIWPAVVQLKENEFLPVHCRDSDEVHRIQTATRRFNKRRKMPPLKTFRDGLTLWIGRKPKAAEAQDD